MVFTGNGVLRRILGVDGVNFDTLGGSFLSVLEVILGSGVDF